MTTDTILKVESLSKYFHDPVKFQVLQDINFEIKKGDFVSIIGKSGCGKSTLLYCLSTMDRDYEGNIEISGQTVTGMGVDALAELRGQNIGFVFQFHYLLPEFSCIQNVMIPALKLGRWSEKEIEERAFQKLKLLGLEDQALKEASKLSGGQQQRVAIARALINDPAIIMGDEPTGNLDSKNTAVVFDILQDLSASQGQTIIAVTHDMDFANRSSRIIEMGDGKIINHGY
jgi:lipoprotein-releasing system ATP-binding protein